VALGPNGSILQAESITRPKTTERAWSPAALLTVGPGPLATITAHGGRAMESLLAPCAPANPGQEILAEFQISPLLTASAVAWARLLAPSFARMSATLRLTVASLQKSLSATSLFVAPSARSRRTPNSDSERSD